MANVRRTEQNPAGPGGPTGQEENLDAAPGTARLEVGHVTANAGAG